MLTGKTVFITGASSGIGLATAEAFARHKARLILCARRSDRLKTLAEKLTREYNTECYYFKLDVRSNDAVKEAITALPANWQNIDILVNNAGLARGFTKLQDNTPENWDDTIDTNLKGLLYITHALLPKIMASKSGHIINLGSIAGHEAYPNGNVYCATKFAVRALSQSLRMDLLGTGVRVSLISPGLVETEFSVVRFDGDTEKAKTPYQGLKPLTAGDIADAIIYAASAPLHVNISEIVMTPTAQASATQIYRE